MKKIIFTLMGLCTLIACSDDALVEAEQHGNEMNSPPTFNPQDPGGNSPLTPGGNYLSPWDIWFRNEPLLLGGTPLTPAYTFTNGGGSHSSPYIVYAYAYVGLAYYDGTNDGQYHDSREAFFNPPGLIADLTIPGLYPNLWQNGQEVGNFIRVELPIKLDGSYLIGSECAITSFTDHLPIDSGSIDTGGFPVGAVNPLGQFFDLANYSVATLDEQLLLQEYGKVFYYEVIIVDAWSNTLFQDFLPPEINTLGAPDFDWQPVEDLTGTTHLEGDFPPLGNAKLYFYENQATPITLWDPYNPNDPNGICDSREVVLGVSGYHDFEFVSPSPAGFSTVSLDFSQGDTFWRGSSLWLRVEP